MSKSRAQRILICSERHFRFPIYTYSTPQYGFRLPLDFLKHTSQVVNDLFYGHEISHLFQMMENVELSFKCA
jgi:hypothetical protein